MINESRLFTETTYGVLTKHDILFRCYTYCPTQFETYSFKKSRPLPGPIDQLSINISYHKSSNSSTNRKHFSSWCQLL